jgi:hypothetical protein
MAGIPKTLLAAKLAAVWPGAKQARTQTEHWAEVKRRLLSNTEYQVLGVLRDWFRDNRERMLRLLQPHWSDFAGIQSIGLELDGKYPCLHLWIVFRRSYKHPTLRAAKRSRADIRLKTGYLEFDSSSEGLPPILTRCELADPNQDPICWAATMVVKRIQQVQDTISNTRILITNTEP